MARIGLQSSRIQTLIRQRVTRMADEWWRSQKVRQTLRTEVAVGGKGSDAQRSMGHNHPVRGREPRIEHPAHGKPVRLAQNGVVCVVSTTKEDTHGLDYSNTR